jgi:type I restriction enzyme S subunit
VSEGNGDLPNGWAHASIEDLAHTATGGTPSRKREGYYGGSILWVKSGDLQDGYVSDIPESITEAGLKNSNAKIFSKGTVCIALYGATVGKLGILERDAATNQAVCGIFPFDGVEPRYIFYALRNERSNLIAQSKGGAQPNISNGIVRKVSLRIPPTTEQRRIVAKIEALQERSRRAREALSEVGPLLEQFRQSAFVAI